MRHYNTLTWLQNAGNPISEDLNFQSFVGMISLYLLQGITFGGTYLEPLSLKFCISHCHCIMKKAHTTA